MSKGMLGMLPLSAVQGPMDTLTRSLAGENGAQVLEELKKFNRGQVCWSDREKKIVERPKLLNPSGRMSACTLEKNHDPALFYQELAGLWPSSDFLREIVALAKPTKAGAKFRARKRYLLAQNNTTGAMLIEQHPTSVFEASEFCAWLACKLERQPNGSFGELLSNGLANLFLVRGIGGEVFLVDMHWFANYELWSVSAWRLGDEWVAGRQFVSR